MANKYTKLFGAFKRLQNFPLDPSSFYESYEEALEYSENSKVAYNGQLIIVTSGEKSGLYRIVKKDSSEDLTLSARVVENDNLNEEVLKLAKQIETLNNAFEEVEAKAEELGQTTEDFIKKVESEYATKAELENEVKKILGDNIDSIDRIEGAVDTIHEISVWIREHDNLLGNLEFIKNEFSNIKDKFEDIYTKEEVNDIISKVNISDQLSGYATKEDLKKLDSAIKQYEITFGDGYSNELELPSGHILIELSLIIERAARVDLLDTISLNLTNDLGENGNPVSLSEIDFSEPFSGDNINESLNWTNGITYKYTLHKNIPEDSKLSIVCDDFAGCYGRLIAKIVRVSE